MGLADRIDLAHEADFALGPLTIRPATREAIRSADAATEVVEPRVMQALVALHRADGGVVSRDDLVQSCWEGRIVGEDAINRVIGRLRKLADGLGDGGFRVETITRVGYRLVVGDAIMPPARRDAGISPAVSPPTRRRLLIDGGAAAGMLAVASGAVWWLRPRRHSSPEVQRLLDQAWQYWTQADSAGYSQAIGLYRRATELEPDNADAWGLLGCIYADRAQVAGTPAERADWRQRAREASRRALELDSRNPYGRAANVYAQPVRGHWWEMERVFKDALAERPQVWLLTYSLALLYTHVGRLTDATDYFAQLRGTAPTATQYHFHATALWGAGRTAAAERLLEEAAGIYAAHPLIWSDRFDLLLTGGHPAAAKAMTEDTDTAPAMLSRDWLERRGQVAAAVASNDAATTRRVAGALLVEGRRAAWPASRAIQDLATLGRLDEAFALANAYFFSRGFAIPDDPPTPAGAAPITLSARFTGFLFLPPMRALWEDARFGRLCDELGLSRYWQESGSRPDFRRSG